MVPTNINPVAQHLWSLCCGDGELLCLLTRLVGSQHWAQLPAAPTILHQPHSLQKKRKVHHAACGGMDGWKHETKEVVDSDYPPEVQKQQQQDWFDATSFKEAIYLSYLRAMLSIEEVEPIVGVALRRALNETEDIDSATEAPTGNGGGDGGETPSPITPSSSNSGNAVAPTFSPVPSPVAGGFAELEDEAKEAFENMGFVMLGIIIAVAVCGMWRFWVCCRNRRERRMLQLVSARADNVLGDMQVSVKRVSTFRSSTAAYSCILTIIILTILRTIKDDSER